MNAKMMAKQLSCPAMPTLAVIILTHNEEIHLPRALDSIAEIATQVFVIDSGSTDSTIAIARARGADVVHREWTNYAQQFQWALDTLPITADWVMRLDADEVIEPDLRARIAADLGTLPAAVTGVNLKRKHIFLGRWVRHGGRYPLVLLRIWRRGQARIEQRWMDEHMVLLGGQSTTFDGGFSDINLKDVTFFTEKHNHYATREAVDVINQRLSLFVREGADNVAASAQAKAKRSIKEGIYNRLPFGWGPTLYFLFRYICQFGFLDGREGAIYHALQGWWYRYLVDVKVLELSRELEGLGGQLAIDRLAQLTGLKLPGAPSVTNRQLPKVTPPMNRSA
jgi:glycosyltransferase involved in cell wall biosynthesis